MSPSPPTRSSPRRPRARLGATALALSLAACELQDAGPGVVTTGEDAGTTGAPPDATAPPVDPGGAGCERDAWEPNPDAATASPVEWDSADPWTAWRSIDDATLCAGEEDWYRFDVERLGYTVHAVYIRALVAGAGLCGADCGETVIPAGPQHAMTLEVHRGDASQLLMAQTADDGVLALDGWGDDFSHPLLIRVYSPTPSARYPYRLTVNIRNYEGEDECEC